MTNTKYPKKVYWLILAVALALISIICIILSVLRGDDSLCDQWTSLLTGILLLLISAVNLSDCIRPNGKQQE